MEANLWSDEQKSRQATVKDKVARMSTALGSVITNKIIAKPGYTSMLDYYLTVCENERTAVYRAVRTVV